MYQITITVNGKSQTLEVPENQLAGFREAHHIGLIDQMTERRFQFVKHPAGGQTMKAQRHEGFRLLR